MRTQSRGFTLIECLFYVSVWSVVAGLALAVFYRTLDNSRGVQRITDDITRTLQAGERWRADVRHSTGPLRVVTDGGYPDQAVHIPTARGETVYYFTGTNVLRRIGQDAPWVEVLGRVAHSKMTRDSYLSLSAWRWEVELKPAKTTALQRPLFTFQAVPPLKN